MSAINLSRIFSSNNIQDLKQHIEPSKSGNTRSLIFCDFDDMLVTSGSEKAFHLGGPRWRSDFRKYTAELKTNPQLFEYVSLFIAKLLPPKAVQGSQTIEAIREWEEMGSHVVVYTARGRSGKNAWYKLNTSEVDTLTKQQLENAGITIQQHPTPLKHSQAFENRMIFSQNIPKEQLLPELFDQKVFDPSDYHQILFSDDKKEYVEKLRKPINERGISYVGMHYNYVEELEKKEYHLFKSTIQLVNLLAIQQLLEPQDLENQCDQMRKQGITADGFFKDVLIQIDQALTNDHVYEKVDLDVEQVFDKIQKAVSAHFKRLSANLGFVDLFVKDLYPQVVL